MNPIDIDQAVLSTLAYAAVFRSGIAFSRLHAWLLTPRKVSVRELNLSLTRLIKRGLVRSQGKYVCLSLPQISLNNLQLREQESVRKYQAFAANVHRISWIPSIQGIAVTGSVAAWNSTENDDIDLMIVTSSNTMWMTRLIVLCASFLLGTLRFGTMKHTQNLWCFNVWLDEDALILNTQTAYIARELVQARWVVDKNQCRSEMLAANSWIRSFVGNTTIPHLSKVSQHKKLLPFLWVERLAYALQIEHMKRNRTREVTTPHSAFFHPRDTNTAVQKSHSVLKEKMMKRYTMQIKKTDKG